MVNIQGYTSKEIAQRIEAITGRPLLWPGARKEIHRIAKERGFTVVAKIGGANVYSRFDVDEYLDARQRTKLLRDQGWLKGRPGQGLVEHDEHDLVCPVKGCDAFAVEKPATIEEMRADAVMPWVCAVGHKSEPPFLFLPKPING